MRFALLGGVLHYLLRFFAKFRRFHADFRPFHANFRLSLVLGANFFEAKISLVLNIHAR